MESNGRRIVIAASALIALGLLAIYAGSSYVTEARFHDPFLFFRKQLLWVALSVIGLLVCSGVPYGAWGRWRWPILALTLGGLVLVLVPGIGSRFNGATRWIRFGSFGLQPSEFAKVGMTIVLASFLADRGGRVRTFWGGFLPAFAMIGAACALTLLEPDVGTALFLGGSLTVVLILGGIRILHLLPVGFAVVALAVPVMIASGRFEYIWNRIDAHLHPDGDHGKKSYQITQAKMAVGRGGLTGDSAGAGIGALGYVPELHSDFIFAAIAEQFGLVGGGVVLALFLTYLLSGYGLTTRAPDRFGALLAFGLTFTTVAQAAFNLAVVTGMAPTKGISLPFVGFGGSSLLATMCGVGILVNLSQTIAEREKGVESRSVEREKVTADSPSSAAASA